MAAHSGLTGADLHEPKGAASANAGDVYVANGTGSGAWTAGVNVQYLNLTIADVSTASSSWVVAPFAGTITEVWTVIDGALATADAAITVEIGGTAVTDAGITITQSGSAAGDVDTSTPSALNTVTAGQAIEVITDGASTNAVKAQVTLVVKLS